MARCYLKQKLGREKKNHFMSKYYIKAFLRSQEPFEGIMTVISVLYSLNSIFFVIATIMDFFPLLHIKNKLTML